MVTGRGGVSYELEKMNILSPNSFDPDGEINYLERIEQLSDNNSIKSSQSPDLNTFYRLLRIKRIGNEPSEHVVPIGALAIGKPNHTSKREMKVAAIYDRNRTTREEFQAGLEAALEKSEYNQEFSRRLQVLTKNLVENERLNYIDPWQMLHARPQRR